MIPYQIRIQPELLEEVQESSNKYSEDNVNREIRELLRIGLKQRKEGRKKINTGGLELAFI
ncbi:MAG: hypothetical protein ACEPOW_13995 [Bacteroidales bacterium]